MIMTSAGAAAAEYADVSEGDWYCDSVAYVNEKGIMQGVSDKAFEPNGIVTRGMLVTMLHRLDGELAVKDAESFADVPAGAYYETAVGWASKKKLVSGYGNGNFGPDDAITREQMALIMFRFSAYRSFAWSNKGKLEEYADSGSISSYATYAMGWAEGFGFLKGSDGLLNPKGYLTRAEAAAILMRFCEQFMPDFGNAGGTEQVDEKEWYVLDITGLSDEEIGDAVDKLIRDGVYDIKTTPMIHYPAQYVVRDVLNEWCAEDKENRAGKISLYYDKTTYITSYGFQNCFALGEFYGPEVEKLEQCAFIEAQYMTKLYAPLVDGIRSDELWGCDRLTDITVIGW